jgi:hypothetical protein
MPRFPDTSDNTHYASGLDEDEVTSHTSVSGIWTEGANAHRDGGIFCPVCEKKRFFNWIYTFCGKCGFERPKEVRCDTSP